MNKIQIAVVLFAGIMLGWAWDDITILASEQICAPIHATWWRPIAFIADSIFMCLVSIKLLPDAR